MRAVWISLVAVFLGVWLAHGAKPHVLSGSLNFVYDPNSGYFGMTSVSKCYITKLSHVEREHARSKTGLQELELKMIREWIGVLNETLVLHTDSAIPDYFQRSCHGQDIFYLGRTLVPDTTFPSILG